MVRYDKGATCYGVGDYVKELPLWFMAIRCFLVSSAVVGYTNMLFCVYRLVKSSGPDHLFLVPSILSFSSGGTSLIALIMFVGYWDFDFLEDIRLEQMAWIEDMEV